MSKQLNSIADLSRTVAGSIESSSSFGKLSDNRSKYAKCILGGFIIVGLIGIYLFLSKTGALEIMMNREMLQVRIDQLGLWGPLMIISLIAVAIVFSPLPSAPIALAAGAVYGHTYGTVYVLIGSMTGAIVAFSIARALCYDIVHKWIDNKLSIKLPGGQNTLMGILFVSRLIPFLSFDSISYLAGLTALSFWRFTVATFAGIIPASFLLAHFGSEIVEAEAERSVLTVILFGGITLVPLALTYMKTRRHK